MQSVEPWIPPLSPDLASLAMVAADEAGLTSLQAWPEVQKSGIAFGSLPPFLCWRGYQEGAWHLVLLQPREVGALVPGARPAALPVGWLDRLDLVALARPLSRHPEFPGGAAVQVVQLPGGPLFRVRTFGRALPELVVAVLQRLTPIQVWNLTD